MLNEVPVLLQRNRIVRACQRSRRHLLLRDVQAWRERKLSMGVYGYVLVLIRVCRGVLHLLPQLGIGGLQLWLARWWMGWTLPVYAAPQRHVV
jgi:hypothetical protein